MSKREKPSTAEDNAKAEDAVPLKPGDWLLFSYGGSILEGKVHSLSDQKYTAVVVQRTTIP